MGVSCYDWAFGRWGEGPSVPSPSMHSIPSTVHRGSRQKQEPGAIIHCPSSGLFTLSMPSAPESGCVISAKLVATSQPSSRRAGSAKRSAAMQFLAAGSAEISFSRTPGALAQDDRLRSSFSTHAKVLMILMLQIRQ